MNDERTTAQRFPPGSKPSACATKGWTADHPRVSDGWGGCKLCALPGVNHQSDAAPGFLTVDESVRLENAAGTYGVEQEADWWSQRVAKLREAIAKVRGVVEGTPICPLCRGDMFDGGAPSHSTACIFTHTPRVP